MTHLARARQLVIAAGALLLGASGAQAGVYAVIAYGPDVMTVIDPSAVERVAGGPGLRRAWSVSIKRSLVDSGPPQPGYVRMLNEYDCAKRQLRSKGFSVYSRFGALVMQKDSPEDAWTVAPPGSEAEAGLRVVCDAYAGRSAIAAKSISQVVIGQMQAWDEAAPLPPLQPVTPQAAKKPTKRR